MFRTEQNNQPQEPVNLEFQCGWFAMPSARKVLLWAGGLSVVLLLIKLIFDQLAPHDESSDDSQHYHVPVGETHTHTLALIN